MTQASGTQLPKRSKTVSSWERGTGTTTAPRQVVGSQASWRPCGSNATEGPAIEACTTGRPDSSAPCCCGPQVLWKVVVALCTTIRSAPILARFQDMSGNADSKQISGPNTTEP